MNDDIRLTSDLGLALKARRLDKAGLPRLEDVQARFGALDKGEGNVA